MSHELTEVDRGDAGLKGGGTGHGHVPPLYIKSPGYQATAYRFAGLPQPALWVEHAEVEDEH